MKQQEDMATSYSKQEGSSKNRILPNQEAKKKENRILSK